MSHRYLTPTTTIVDFLRRQLECGFGRPSRRRGHGTVYPASINVL